MKISLMATVIAFGGLMHTAFAADSLPALPIGEALKIAQNYLKDRAPDRQIISIALEPTTLRTQSWYARWSSPIVEPGKKETGLRIDMEGNLVRIVETNASAAVRQQRIGARNIR